MNIRVMPDYTSTGLWGGETKDSLGNPIEFDEIDIPLELKARIEKWNKVYDDATFYREEPWEGGAKADIEAMDWINNESVIIGKALKQLYPDWQVEIWIETHDDGKLSGILKLKIEEFVPYRVTSIPSESKHA